MRVAMYYRNNDIRLEEMPRPKISAGEILVRSMACGVCGSKGYLLERFIGKIILTRNKIDEMFPAKQFH